MTKLFNTLFLLFIGTIQLYAQTATIVGTITNEDNEILTGANVYLEGTNIGESTNEEGKYRLIVPANERIIVVTSFVGHKTVKNQLKLTENQAIKLDIRLETIIGEEVVVRHKFEASEIGLLSIDAKDIEQFPTTTGSLEQTLTYLTAGVTAGTGGELTSQYSVRGGNYDENLVYVNDFEVYRPLLVRSGQQEGLSFPNADLMQRLTFFSGGFGAEYGDKMSSVLDVEYKRPTRFGASLSGSFLGGSAHIEGAKMKKNSTGKGNERFTYLLGARYKTTRSLLGTQDVKGEYIPTFIDLQGNITYDIHKKWRLELIGNFNKSIFSLRPSARQTVTGLFNLVLELSVADFQGREYDDFTTYLGGVSLRYQANRNLSFKWLASHYQSYENERFDILAPFSLNVVDRSLNSQEPGKIIASLGFGENQLYIRNYLTTNVTNAEWKGAWSAKNELKDSEHLSQWGIKYQNENINDNLKEWTRIDSLGYSLPFDSAKIVLHEYIRAKININSNRFSAYAQHTWSRETDNYLFRLVVGVRTQYWTLNKEAVISPRLQAFFAPKNSKNYSDSTGSMLKFSVGAYYQPPFYRELRNLEGMVNTDVKAQKSIHFVGGWVRDFYMWKRRFKFITEAYYKILWDLVPYDIDNVRIRYYGDNMAKGYVAGLDLRMNGEFVKGAESWINLSFLRAREKLDNIQHLKYNYNKGTGKYDLIEVKDVPRPTDQAVLLSMYFQDYLPRNKNFKANIAFTVGTGLSFGIPRENEIYRNTGRFTPYHRIDIGFSAALWDKSKFEKKATEKGIDAKRHFLNFAKSAWLSLEVFNLMAVANVSSYTWVRDFSGTTFAIPNYLTSRRINLRLRMNF